MDIKAKLERSRQSARECRARKKLRYQYLEELVADREKAVFALRKELEKYKLWSKELDEQRWPDGLQAFLEEMGSVKQEM
ncbi:REPTOR-binding partner isoform X1 [Halyomorpha halys]|uniref:REPTOR-binding partner isoform X1 n=1 Tax=Halyomorpha halys TaxID=286706 RepID=UPI0006D4D32E|nr:cAMP-responsive element-binding protein-like 2 isoform X1 [Halyomorpha halys]